MNNPGHTGFCIKLLLLTAILVSNASCVMIPYDVTEYLEPPIQQGQLKNFKPGTISRARLIAWFGPPDAIARQGAIIKVSPRQFRKKGSDSIDSQRFFALFPEHKPVARQYIIYYYETSEAYGTGAVLATISGAGSGPITSIKMKSSRLWILIDTRTDYAVDYVFKETLEPGK